MKQKKTVKTTKHIPMINRVKDSCLDCPFFELRNNRNSAHGECNADDLERAIDYKMERKPNAGRLKVTGRYSPNSIIKVPIPKWCPLKIGDAIITLRKSPHGWKEEMHYNMEKKTLTHYVEEFDKMPKIRKYGPRV